MRIATTAFPASRSQPPPPHGFGVPRRSEDRNSLVGAAFPVLSSSKGSHDLAISTNFLILQLTN
jgi:hypothetical protein